MPTTITPPNGSAPEIERELHELEDANDALDQRTGNLELRGTFGTLFAFFSLAVALAALTVALVSAGGKKTVTVLQAAKPAPAAAAPAAAAAVPGSVSVKLGEMFVRPDVTQGAAGKVTFHVQNTGKLIHEMIVGRPPIKGPLATGKMSEATSVGEVAVLKPGTAGSVKLSLKPGTYILYCNIPGHFAAGQHVAFTVTKS
ncbi:MAG: hypothetical protein QOJ29_4344 [Thermoleophilaceae bacterium]|nr:hypothetical protein [Thermoleophilaceae bacterium]